MNKRCGVYSVVLLHGCRQIVPLLLVQFLCACLQLVFAGGLGELVRESDALFVLELPPRSPDFWWLGMNGTYRVGLVVLDGRFGTFSFFVNGVR